jgi:hypothetical protein
VAGGRGGCRCWDQAGGCGLMAGGQGRGVRGLRAAGRHQARCMLILQMTLPTRWCQAGEATWCCCQTMLRALPRPTLLQVGSAGVHLSDHVSVAVQIWPCTAGHVS